MLTLRQETAFIEEVNLLSQMVIGRLQKLTHNPRDLVEIQKLVQSADTIMGDARFLQDKDLEKKATHIVKSFKEVEVNIKKESQVLSTAYKNFSKLVTDGTCPKGYKMINGKCIRIESST